MDSKSLYRIMDFDGAQPPQFIDGVRYLYDNGLPFTGGSFDDGQDRHAWNLDQLRARVEARKASLIIISGGLGEGKTTIAVHTADYYTGRWIRFEEQIFMGGEKFIKGIKVCFEKGHAVVIYDESGDFDKRGALSRLNRTLGRVFDIFRAFKIIVILVLPSFFALDNGLFEKNIPRMLIQCSGRTRHQGNFDVYSLDRMMWLRYHAKTCIIRSDAFKKVQANYSGHFLDLHPSRSKELDRYSTKGKLDVVDLAEIKGDGLLSYADLASKLNTTHENVRRRVSKLGIVPSKIWKAKKYFTEADLARLKRK